MRTVIASLAAMVLMALMAGAAHAGNYTVGGYVVCNDGSYPVNGALLTVYAEWTDGDGHKQIEAVFTESNEYGAYAATLNCCCGAPVEQMTPHRLVLMAEAIWHLCPDDTREAMAKEVNERSKLWDR